MKAGIPIAQNAIAIALALVFAVSAAADVKAPGKGTPTERRGEKDEDMEYREEQRIPIPLEKQGKVLRGRTIRFMLETLEDLPAQRIDFIIRKEPKYGRLLEIEDVPGRQSAKIVEYIPDTSRSAPDDTFTFSARYPEGRFSAPSTIKIEIATPQPVIQLPPNVHFRAVLVGQTGLVEIPVKNIGNDFFEGSLDVFEKGGLWAWVPPEGATTIRLDPEEQTMATFSFSPKAPGVKTGSMSLTPGFDNTVARFTGDGVIPFAVSRTKVELAFDPASRLRIGRLTISPRSTENFILHVVCDERLTVSNGKQIFLNSGQPHELELRLPAEDPMPLNDELTITADGFTRKIKVIGVPSPPKLEVALKNTVSSTLDFGSVEPGEEVSRVFGLRNLGGVPTEAEFVLPAPFELDEPDEVFEIPANTERQFEVWFRPDERGGFRETVQLAPNSEQLLVTLRGIAGATLLVDPSMDLENLGLGSPMTAPLRSQGGNPRPLLGSSGRPRTPTPGPGSPGPGGTGGSGKHYSDLFQDKPPSLEELGDRARLIEEIPAEVIGEAGKIALPPMITRDRMLAHSPFKTKTDLGLPRIERFAVNESKTRSVELIFPKPTGLHSDYEVEARITSFNKKKKRYECVWVPMPNVKYAVKDLAVTAEIQGLQPDAYYLFRVFSKGDGGTNSLPSEEFGAHTLSPPSSANLASYLAIGGMVILIVAGFYLYMRNAGLV